MCTLCGTRGTGYTERRTEPRTRSGRRRYMCKTASVSQALAVFFFSRRPAAPPAHVPRGVPSAFRALHASMTARARSARDLSRHTSSTKNGIGSTSGGGLRRAAGAGARDAQRLAPDAPACSTQTPRRRPPLGAAFYVSGVPTRGVRRSFPAVRCPLGVPLGVKRKQARSAKPLTCEFTGRGGRI